MKKLVTGFGPGRRRTARLAEICLGWLWVLAVVALLLGFAAAPVAHAASIVVTNLNDSGAGSLRQAIADAAPGDTINFSVSGTITLTSGELLVNKNLTLSGPGAAGLKISGNRLNPSLASRVIHNSAHLTLSGLTIRDGQVSFGLFGGGILNDGTGVLTITNSLITGNFAQQGGGVYNSAGGSVNIINSTFSSNETRLFDIGADANGAGLYNAAPGGVVTITGSTFYFNLVHDYGGGLFNAGTATVANSTFWLNQAGGTAAINNTGILHLNNVTVSANSGRKQGSGLRAGIGSVTTVQNSIIAANNGGPSDCDGSITSGGYNLIGYVVGCGWIAGPGDQLGTLTAIDPKLGTLTINGGPTLTMMPLAGSPAIDAGSPAAPGSGGGACEASDQRGALRPFLGATSLTCDIGAVELGATGLLASNSGPTLLGQVTSFTANGLAAGFTYHWDFGDGVASNVNPATHTYLSAGHYLATVTATNGVVSLIATTQVTIFPAPGNIFHIFLPNVSK